VPVLRRKHKAIESPQEAALQQRLAVAGELVAAPGGGAASGALLQVEAIS